MTLIKQIKLAQQMGYNVTYYKRTDGGYLVKSINGVSFTGAKGNAQIRGIVGASLSAKKQAQLKSIERPRVAPIRQDIEKLFKKVQRKLRAKKTKDKSNGIERAKKGGYELKIKKRTLRKNIQAFGEQQAIASLNKALKYIEGIAYEENVEALIERIGRLAIQFPTLTNNVEEVKNKIRLKKDKFKEEWIEPINAIIYECEQRNDVAFTREGLKQILRIIA